jgi:putative peptidoglycan lipid II flippase
MNLVSVVLSYLVAVWLEPKWVTVGLAAIFTLHYFIGVGISFYLIKRHQVKLPLLSIMLYYLKLIAIFALVITPIWLLRGAIPGGNLISLLLVTSLSGIFYLLIAKLLKISEVSDLLKVIRSRKV